MRLHVLDGCELRHVGGAGSPEHLVRDALDFRLLASLLEDTEEEVVRVDGGSSAVSGRERDLLEMKRSAAERNSIAHGELAPGPEEKAPKAEVS